MFYISFFLLRMGEFVKRGIWTEYVRYFQESSESMMLNFLNKTIEKITTTFKCSK